MAGNIEQGCEKALLSLPGVGVFGTDLASKALIWMLQSAGFRIEAIWGRTDDDANKLAVSTKFKSTIPDTSILLSGL